MLNFPQAIDAAAAHQGVTAARERGACIVGAWLAGDVDASGLEAAGFERGWEPWWMTASLESVADPDDDRVVITTEVPEYGPEGQRLLSLADAPEARAWHAVARVDGHLAGRGWAFAPRDIAGIYDMDVWPAFQRQGLGRALLRKCALQRAPQERTQQYSTQHRTVSGCTQLRASSGSARASPIGTISADSPPVAPTSPSSPTRHSRSECPSSLELQPRLAWPLQALTSSAAADLITTAVASSRTASSAAHPVPTATAGPGLLEGASRDCFSRIGGAAWRRSTPLHGRRSSITAAAAGIRG